MKITGPVILVNKNELFHMYPYQGYKAVFLIDFSISSGPANSEDPLLTVQNIKTKSLYNCKQKPKPTSSYMYNIFTYKKT